MSTGGSSYQWFRSLAVANARESEQPWPIPLSQVPLRLAHVEILQMYIMALYFIDEQRGQKKRSWKSAK